MSSGYDGFWARIWRKPRTKWLLGIPLGGFAALVIGVAGTAGFTYSLYATSTNEFCVSCHEMSEFVYPEYQQSHHYTNAAGVRAGCADCHLPKPFFLKMKRKIQATLVEVPGHLAGVIDTREKFEAHRWTMAQSVWAEMRENDSITCRSCHSRDAMALDLQDRRARRRHTQEYYEESGKTCIDCHTGVAHADPSPPLPTVPAETG